jgi:hypothetical protein
MKGQGGGQVVGLGAGKYVLLPARKPADWFFASILKVNDENNRILIQELDPLVRGIDPPIRIRTKMS